MGIDSNVVSSWVWSLFRREDTEDLRYDLEFCNKETYASQPCRCENNQKYSSDDEDVVLKKRTRKVFRTHVFDSLIKMLVRLFTNVIFFGAFIHREVDKPFHVTITPPRVVREVEIINYFPRKWLWWKSSQGIPFEGNFSQLTQIISCHVRQEGLWVNFLQFPVVLNE